MNKIRDSKNKWKVTKDKNGNHILRCGNKIINQDYYVYYDDYIRLHNFNIYYSVKSLPPLPSKLVVLDISQFSICSIPYLPSTLRSLTMTWCKIEEINNLPYGLKRLDLSCNRIKDIQRLPETLTYCNLSSNWIINLDKASLYSLSSLKYLSVLGNLIERVDYLPRSIKTFIAVYNRINSIKFFPGTLKFINLKDNRLSRIPTLPRELRYLDVSKNTLSSLPTLPKGLEYIDCSLNKLTGVSLPDKVKTAFLQNNQIKSFKSNVYLERLSLTYNPIEEIYIYPRLQKIIPNDFYYDFHINGYSERVRNGLTITPGIKGVTTDFRHRFAYIYKFISFGRFERISKIMQILNKWILNKKVSDIQKVWKRYWYTPYYSEEYGYEVSRYMIHHQDKL